MATKIHYYRGLVKEARKQGIAKGSPRFSAYVYGTLDKIWSRHLAKQQRRKKGKS